MCGTTRLPEGPEKGDIRNRRSDSTATLSGRGFDSRGDWKALGDCGLVEQGSNVVPLQVDLRKAWHETIRSILADGESRFFSIRRCEGISIVGLSTDDRRAEVQVHLPRRAVCSRAALVRLSEVVALTPRERDVLECLSRGSTPAETAQMLGNRLSTVRTQIKGLLAKLDQNGTRELLQFLARLPEV